MKLEKLIQKCETALRNSAEENWYPEWPDYEALSASVPTGDGSIDLFYYYDRKTRKWECNAEIFSNKDEEKDFKNLSEFLSEELSGCIDFDELEKKLEEEEEYIDDYQWNGFSSESDFWDWKTSN